MMKNKQKKVVCTEKLLFCWSRARFFPRYYFLALFSLFSHVLCYGLLCDKKSDFHTFFLDPSHCTQIKLTPSGQTFRNPDFHIDVEQFSDSIGDDEIEQKKNNFFVSNFPKFYSSLIWCGGMDYGLFAVFENSWKYNRKRISYEIRGKNESNQKYKL